MAVLDTRQAPPFDPSILTPEYLAYSNAHEILSITGTFTALALMAVITRFYVRIFMLRQVGVDDYIILLSGLCALLALICFVLQVNQGLGKHTLVWTMIPYNFMQYMRASFAQSLFFVTGISAVKVSVGMFLVRLSDRTMYTRFIWLVIGFTVVFALTCDGTLIFQCLPVAATWDFSLRPPPIGTGNANCFSTNTFRNIGLMNSIINAVTDFVFATMPIPLILKLQMNMRVKISLIAALSLGYFACVAASLKAVQQYNFFNDPDWSIHDSFNVWADIELNIGIIAACLPTIKPLFNAWLETAKALTTGLRGTQKGSLNSQTTKRRPNSLGYIKQESIGLSSVSDRSATRTGNDKYNVRVSTGTNELMSPTGPTTSNGNWSNSREADSRDSETSTFQGAGQVEKGHIVRTTEVKIS